MSPPASIWLCRESLKYSGSGGDMEAQGPSAHPTPPMSQRVAPPTWPPRWRLRYNCRPADAEPDCRLGDSTY